MSVWTKLADFIAWWETRKEIKEQEQDRKREEKIKLLALQVDAEETRLKQLDIIEASKKRITTAKKGQNKHRTVTKMARTVGGLIGSTDSSQPTRKKKRTRK
jgi:hypothetical protein